MIGFVSGELFESRPGSVIVLNNGIGIKINIPETARENLPSIGNSVKFYTHMAVKEDDISLYGFLTHDSLDLFELLLTVNGVGPKGALNMLSFYDAENIKFLIVSGDSNKLSKVPTIGKKTAEKIIIDLKDKISKDDIIFHEKEEEKAALSDNENEAILALTALGYDKNEALAAIKRVENRDGLSVNALLKEALKNIF
jgi:Holliday junction DNA helicase RuvA